MKRLLFSIFALASAAVLADSTTVHTSWPKPAPASFAGYTWTDDSGNEVSFRNDGTEYLVVDSMEWNQSFPYDWNLYGLFLNNATRNYAEGVGVFKLGAGGLRMVSGGRYAVSGGPSVRVRLMADQVWEGPESGSAAAIGLGSDNHNWWSADYHKAMLDADSSVSSWTIAKKLNVWFFYTNRISQVDVRVESPARIYLPTEWKDEHGITSSFAVKLGARMLTLAGDGVMWQAGGTVETKIPLSGIAPSGVLNPSLDASTVAQTLVLEGGADVQTLAATWDIPNLVVKGEGVTSAFTGDLTFLRTSTAVELRDGATLDFSCETRESGVSAALDVSGTGTLRVNPDTWGLTGALTLGDDVTLEIAGANRLGCAVTGGKALVVDLGQGKTCALDTAVCSGMNADWVAVKSGTLCIASMASLPEGATVEVSAGAAVVFASNEGFDPGRMTGAGAANVTFDSKMVTDTAVTEPEIVVCTNEVLRVLGSGLTANTTVRLNGGTLRFEASATVASPVIVSVGSFVEAVSSSVVGTISGAVTCDCGATDLTAPRSVSIPTKWGGSETVALSVTGIVNLGPGTIVYAGGGSFSYSRDRFIVTRDASVYLTHGTYSFGARESSPGSAPLALLPLKGGVDYGYGRLLCVRDGGTVEFTEYDSFTTRLYVAPPKNGAMYNTSPWISVFEVGEGGTVNVPKKSAFYFGSADTRSHLKVSGGTLTFGESSTVYIGDGYATAELDILLSAGTLSLARSILRNTGVDGSGTNRLTRGRLVWSGGTLKLNENFGSLAIFDMPDEYRLSSHWQVNGVLRESVRIEGADCTLDFSEMKRSSVANVPAGMDEAEWYGSGTLTLKGAEGKELVLNAVPNDISFRLVGNGTKVTVPPEAFVYDRTECLKYANWNDNDRGKPYSVTNGALSAAAIATFAFAGTNCTFAVTRDDLPLTVAKAYVTGEWNNARSLTAVGGLTLNGMEFAEGSTLVAAVRGGRTACQRIAGALTLPASLYVRSARDAGLVPTGSVALTADGGVVGTPTWIGTRRCQAFNDDASVWIELSGMAISIR